nr:hypothetical protein [Tanacetum cinerariifolium]
SGGDVFDLIGDVDPTDKDRDIGMGDSTCVLMSLDGEISSGGKKSQESNSDNTGGTTVGEAMGDCSGGIGNSLVASYACMTSIYGSSYKDEKTSVAKSQNIVEKVEGKSILYFENRMVGRGHRVFNNPAEPLPEDILGVTTLRHTGSHYPKTYWDLLPEDVLGVITRRRTRSHYPKMYWESLLEDVMRCMEMRKGATKHGGDEANDLGSKGVRWRLPWAGRV